MQNIRRIALGCPAVFAALLAACSVETAADELADEPRAGGGPPPMLQDEYWAVGTLKLPTDTCPILSAQDWDRVGTHMFSDATPGLVLQEYYPPDLPDALRRFCLYRYVGPIASLALPSDPLLEHVSFDQGVVEAMGNGLDEAYRPALSDVFLAQAGRLAPDVAAGTEPVMVAVVDSEAERAELPPHIDHASAMAEIIERLACSEVSDACAVSIYRALALPLLETGHWRPDGGYYGTRADVAMGIVESVMAWRNSMEEGPESRLVINLSLGWVTSGALGCGMGEDEPWCEHSQTHGAEFDQWLQTPGPLAFPGQVADEAVHAALLYATCNGALVVAAAGNSKDDSCNGMPIAPAVWARYAAPGAAECAQLGFESPASYVNELYDPLRPLVQPVAAVDHVDDPIFVTRPGSSTRLVAPGYLATTGDNMDPLTGTSVSAAVASAGAALLWSYDHERTPGEVVERLYGTGTEVTRSWEMVEAGEFEAELQTSRLSLCRAADPNCEAGALCESSYCDPEDFVSMRLADLRSEVEQQITFINPTTASLSSLQSDACWSCGEPIATLLPSTSSNGEDFYFFSSCGTTSNSFIPNDGPVLAGPQPDDPPCPDCPVLTSGTEDQSKAVLALDDWYWNKQINGVLLTLQRQGGTTTVIDMSGNQALVQSLRQGQTITVTLPGYWHSSGSPLKKATFGLSVSFNGGQFFRSNELLVIPPSG